MTIAFPIHTRLPRRAFPFPDECPLQIRINRHECCGHAECAELAPNVFAIDPRRKAYVLDAEAAPVEVLIEAAEACPCQAIVVLDDEGERIFP